MDETKKQAVFKKFMAAWYKASDAMQTELKIPVA